MQMRGESGDEAITPEAFLVLPSLCFHLAGARRHVCGEVFPRQRQGSAAMLYSLEIHGGWKIKRTPVDEVV